MIRVIKVMVAVKLGVRSCELTCCASCGWLLVVGGCWWLLVDEKCVFAACIFMKHTMTEDGAVCPKKLP